MCHGHSCIFEYTGNRDVHHKPTTMCWAHKLLSMVSKQSPILCLSYIVAHLTQAGRGSSMWRLIDNSSGRGNQIHICFTTFTGQKFRPTHPPLYLEWWFYLESGEGSSAHRVKYRTARNFHLLLSWMIFFISSRINDYIEVYGDLSLLQGQKYFCKT